MTTPHPLDNPVWASLTSCHSMLAETRAGAARYPADVAPFVAVGVADNQAAQEAARMIVPGEQVCFVGLAPPLPAGWHVEPPVPIAQMIRRSRLEIIEGPDVIELSEAHAADVLALTALVYPHYFRARTMAMGRYLGVYDGNVLAAMAGERMHFDEHCEISAICTHPDYLGRGYARRLIAMLTNDILARDELPFLHFSHDNLRAKALYERIGFVFRTDIALVVATRPADA